MDQESIDTFITITGLSQPAAIRKLQEHSGNLNAAVNAHFIEGDTIINQEASIAGPQDDDMEIDDPVSEDLPGAHSSLSPFANRFAALDPTRSILDGGPDIASDVSDPRRGVREVPIEVNDGLGMSSGNAPNIASGPGSETRDTVIIDDDDDDYIPTAPIARTRPSAPSIVDVPDDIEEEMIRAAIEASKQDVAMSSQPYDDHQDITGPTSRPRQAQVEDAEIAHAVSLSLQAAQRGEDSKEGKVEAPESENLKPVAKEMSSNGRQSELDPGSSSIPDEAEDVEEERQLIRHRRRRVISAPINTTEEQDNEDEVEVIPPSSPQQQDNVHAGDDFASDEWGGISSVEHDEAVMLEAAMFGGIPEESGYRFHRHAPHQYMQNDFDRDVGPSWGIPRPPSPSLTAQRLIREQQDDEYLAALQADREKELKAKEDAEAALESEKLKEEAARQQLEKEQEIERQLADKEASLPQEPASDDENAINLLVRMPDGSRRGRRFCKSDKLQFLFDFIDIGRGVKPGSYRLVRPYPRRAFRDGESTLTLNELGITSKQEALYLELI